MPEKQLPFPSNPIVPGRSWVESVTRASNADVVFDSDSFDVSYGPGGTTVTKKKAKQPLVLGYPWGKEWPWGFVLTNREPTEDELLEDEDAPDVAVLRIYNCIVSVDGKGLFDLGEIGTAEERARRYSQIDLAEISTLKRVLTMKVDWDLITECPRPWNVGGDLPAGFGLSTQTLLPDGTPWGATLAKQQITIGVWTPTGELIIDLIHGCAYPQIWVSS